MTKITGLIAVLSFLLAPHNSAQLSPPINLGQLSVNTSKLISARKKMSTGLKVLITHPTVPQVAIDLLKNFCEIVQSDDGSRSSILEKVAGVDAIFWATKERLDAEILNAAGMQMKTVGIMSAGLNNIDVEELKRRRIKAANTPSVLSDAVANVAILLLLGASRRLHEGRLAIEQNNWKFAHDWMLGRDIAGSTVGIVGLGNIGQTIAKKLQVFQVGQILYTGHREREEAKELNAKFVDFNTLVADSDFVVVACPLTDETRGMFNHSVFSKMKRTAVFVNIARGEIVVQHDLYSALRKGVIFSAGLDVMTPEPLPPNSELLKLPNLVLLPHLGSATHQTRDDMAELTAKNILRGLGGEDMFTPIY